MSSRKAVLGRGLNALLPSQGDEDARSERSGEEPKARVNPFEQRDRLIGRVADIEIDRVTPNPFQPRRDFDEASLEELASSIEQLGVIQPVTVRAVDGGRYEIISGERRLRAARRAGLKVIPAYVREADTEEMLEMALVENVQREALNPIEVALGYQRLIDECTLTQEQVADKVGKNRATVANMLRLLKLPPRIQAGLRDGTLTAGHARALVALDDEADQLRLLKEIETSGLSVREVEDRVRKILSRRGEESRAAQREAEKPAIPDRETLQLRDYTDRLRSHLSTQIQIRHRSSNAGGKIEISYYSDDDLERLMELMLHR